MASPVILRPIPSADGKFIPMLLLLNTQAEQFTNDLILKWTYEDKVEDSELCPRAPVGFPNNLLAQIAEAAASKEHWNTKVIAL